MTLWTPYRQSLALASVERWRGTPHRDHVAIQGVGVDCIHFVASVLQESEIVPRGTMPGYDPQEGLHDRSDRLREAFAACLHGREVDKREPMFGDLAVFKTGRTSGHCGIVLNGMLAHALVRSGVVLTSYKAWRPDVACLFRIEETSYKLNPHHLWRATQD